MGALSWHIMRRKKLQPWVGLPNILCREFVVPEFLQEAASPQALADEVLQWLHPSDHTSVKLGELEQRFQLLHAELQRDTPTLAAHAIAHVLQN
jgi:lipid-A-disaccharide synthase